MAQEASNFQFQCVSDLHLEIEGTLARLPEIPVLAPYLALLGNIGIIFSLIFLLA